MLAANPGRVADVVEVDLPRPRTIGLMKTSHFNAVENAVRQVLFDDDGPVAEPAAPEQAHG